MSQRDYSKQESYQALKAQFEAKKLKSIFNIRNLLDNPTGVAEHPDLISTLVGLSEELADADDILECLEKHFERKKE